MAPALDAGEIALTGRVHQFDAERYGEDEAFPPLMLRVECLTPSDVTI